MHKIWILALLLALLTACTSKDEKALMKSYEKEKTYHKMLLKSEKTQLYDGQYTKAVLTATYVSKQKIDKNEKFDEKFIIGVYLEDSNGTSFIKDGYTLTLNGVSPKSITTLKKEDVKEKGISFVSEWSHFYLVTFPYIKNKRFKLLFKSTLYGKGELNFAKVAKYSFGKRAIF
jgi:hypothetical protein